jgi:hypothetical protein
MYIVHQISHIYDPLSILTKNWIATNDNKTKMIRNDFQLRATARGRAFLYSRFVGYWLSISGRILRGYFFIKK